MLRFGDSLCSAGSRSVDSLALFSTDRVQDYDYWALTINVSLAELVSSRTWGGQGRCGVWACPVVTAYAFATGNRLVVRHSTTDE